MVKPVTQYEVDPGGKFATSIQKALKEVDDLRPAFQTITKSWFKSNRAIFQLKGPGQYADLTPGYKATKEKKRGFVYPILKASGLLEQSMVNAGDSDSVVAMSKTALALGTSRPYAKFLHHGTRKMKARPVIIIGAEQAGAMSELKGRRELWIKQIYDYVFEKTGKALG